MKNIFRISALLALIAIAAVSCRTEEIGTDQFSDDGVALAAIAPNPVMRGGVLRIIGSNLQDVKEVRFAGGVSVTDIKVKTTGPKGEAEVTVPIDGPEVGPVTIVDKNGNEYSTVADLTFTEPIEVASFSPATALSGDVITITGEYLNDVREVIFAGDAIVTEFVSQSRHELKVVLPANALSGYIIVGDVNELEDANTIPNKIYSATELVVGQPVVVKADDATYKAGDVVTVTGEHLDMIQTVDLEGAKGVEFTVSEDGTTITFNVPASATDGAVTLTSYAGDSFNAGNITTVSVANLGIVSNAEDGRYKAGSTVTISGDDLDLVSTVQFGGGVEASFYMDGDKIIATIPDAAQDGSLTLTLESGKQAWTDAIEVVKPIVTGIDKTEAKAGEAVTVSGTDLDLVTEVVIGDKANGLIVCDYEIADDATLKVTLSRQAYTGPLTLTAASGYKAETEVITVAYSEPINIVFDSYQYALGGTIDFGGENLLLIESIYIAGNKVTDYLLRADDRMSIGMPDGIHPGVNRLDVVLVDGTELTWPVPFEVTAPFTETFIWKGAFETGDYANNAELGGEDDWVNAELQVGDNVRIYFTAQDPADWSIQAFTGHWAAMNMLFPDSEKPNQFNPVNSPDAISNGYITFVVTQEIYDLFTEKQWWGSAIILQGKNLTFTGVSMIHYGATETIVWEGAHETGDYAANAELGGEDDWVNNELFVGATVRIYFTPQDPADWSIQAFTGHWASMDMLFPGAEKPNQFNPGNSPDAITNGYVSFEVTQEIYDLFTEKQWWGSAIILQGKNLTFTKVAFI